jgi:predicted RNase H-like HicB family nuclease
VISFIAYIRKEKESDYGVEFPDVPGCVTVGRTFDEARCMAAEALIGHMAILEFHGEAVPVPSTMEALKDDPNRQDAVLTFVDLLSKI